jgi:UvrD-like helicase family protein
LSRPTGAYDLLGKQLFENGQLRFDTVYRFKGQQAPAIILTDVDPGQDRPDHAERQLFTAMTRATVCLESSYLREIARLSASWMSDRIRHATTAPIAKPPGSSVSSVVAKKVQKPP